MVLGVTGTLFALAVIWLSTVVLAFRAARLSAEAKRGWLAHVLAILILVLIAAILVTDAWYVDVL